MGTILENRTTLKKVLNIVFYVVLAIVFIYAMFGLFSKKENNSISFLGVTSMSVQSDSMLPAFKEGDLIFISTDFDTRELNEGDVITYIDFKQTSQGLVTYYNTHRIVDIDKSGTVWRFTTRGDNNSSNDPRILLENEIFGVWNERSWSGFGKFADNFTDFLKSSLGFFLFIVLPCLALLVYEVIKFMKVYAEYNVQKHTADRVSLQEEAIRIAREQIEAEAKSEVEKKDTNQQE